MSGAPAVDRFLRGEGEFAVEGRELPWRSLLVLLVTGSAVYGAAMGSTGVSPLQSVYSGIKVPLLLVCTSLVCLPSFYVVNAVLGLREDFALACRGIVAAQSAQGVALGSLAPLILVVYLSDPPMESWAFWNGALFALATVAGYVVLRRHYAPLVARDRRHRLALMAWLPLYVFVAIQLAWVLRPFLGTPGYPVAFLRDEPWSNAYVVLIELLLRLQ